MTKTTRTDLYQLTMSAAYQDNGKDDIATFELFVRSLPTDWGYFIANGIEEAINYATSIRFTDKDIGKLRKKTELPESYLQTLKDFTFEGDIEAIKEGTPFFPNEPIMRVTAKRTQAQFLETTLLNIINHQSMIATKASRVVNAAAPAKVVDFGLRRAQGGDAGLLGARAAYIAGAIGTSNVEAGLEYDEIPFKGTHAHSFVMSFEHEIDAFRAYTKTFPDNATLLIDTYDTLQGARNATVVAKELQAQGHKLGAVRLDSGDLATLARQVRSILNQEGLLDVKILASNDLNEYKIAELMAKGAPINGYGVGTEMITAKPVAAISGVYKIVDDEQGPKIKLSEDKKSLPGRHQVFRFEQQDGYGHDIIALDGEAFGGRPLLEPAVRGGERVRQQPTLDETRAYCLAEVEKLHHGLKQPRAYHRYSVRLSDKLQSLSNKLTARHLYTPEDLAQSYA